MQDVIKVKATFPKGFKVVVASDAHYWPGRPSTAHRALCNMISSFLFPDVVVMNGDMFDFPTISKYPPNGWTKVPSVVKEIAIVQKRLAEVAKAARLQNPKARLIWTMGNHDARFNKALATKAPQFKELPGTELTGYFPEWEFCWRAEIGDVVIKHELKGGANPLKSNLAASGKSIVTGHHHCQNVLAHTDYAGTRYAVDAGCLAAVGGPQFDYGEGNPANWRSGFAVLQFWEGKVRPPQLVTVLDEKKGLVHHNGHNYKFTTH